MKGIVFACVYITAIIIVFTTMLIEVKGNESPDNPEIQLISVMDRNIRWKRGIFGRSSSSSSTLTEEDIQWAKQRYEDHKSNKDERMVAYNALSELEDRNSNLKKKMEADKAYDQAGGDFETFAKLYYGGN